MSEVSKCVGHEFLGHKWAGIYLPWNIRMSEAPCKENISHVEAVQHIIFEQFRIVVLLTKTTILFNAEETHANG